MPLKRSVQKVIHTHLTGLVFKLNDSVKGVDTRRRSVNDNHHHNYSPQGSEAQSPTH